MTKRKAEEEAIKTEIESKTEDDIKKEDEIIQCKTVHFCYGEGLLAFYQINNSAHLKTIPSQKITFCISSNCNHITENENVHLYVDWKKLKMTIMEIQAFITFTKFIPALFLGKLKNDEYDINKMKINYFNLIWLFEYFLMDKHYTENLKAFLKEYSITKAKFVYPISALSVFEFTEFTRQEKRLNNTGRNFHPMLQIAYEESISLPLRLKYLTMHFYGDLIYQTTIMTKEYVSETLNIEIDLLHFLSPKTCIIAGGAALKLGCPKSKFTLKCDVDFFLLKNEMQKQTLEAFLKLLKLLNERYIFTYDKNKSCYSAIGKYGIRRIQLIVSDHENAIDVIKDFDLAAVRAYYDGELFHPTIGALNDWLHMTVSLSTYYNIKANRLFCLWWKGFSLSQEAEIFLKNTIGWPPTKDFEDQFANHIPFIVDEVPIEIQIANLYSQFHLVAYKEEPKEETKEETKQETKEETKEEPLEKFTLSRYGRVHNVFRGSWNDYAKFCKVKISSTTNGFQSLIGNEKPLYHDVQSDYVIQLNNCKLRDCNNDKSLILDDIEIAMRDILLHTIPNELFKQLTKLLKQPTRQLFIQPNNIVLLQITDASQLYINGLQVPKTKFPKEQAILARIFIRPLYFYETKYQKDKMPAMLDVKLRYGITQLYCVL